MRKLILFSFFMGLLAVSCNDTNQKEENVRYSQDSEEINTLKAVISDYEKGSWESYKSHFADTARVYQNSNDGRSIDEIVTRHQNNTASLSNYNLIDDSEEFEMVVTDDDETWVNYWGNWEATLKGNNKKVLIPIHLTARFIDGKIVEEHGYWDNSIMMMAMEEADTTKTDSIN